jgi:hypothetical protein
MEKLAGPIGAAMGRSLRISNQKLKTVTNWRPKYPSLREGWPAGLVALQSAEPAAALK